MFVPGDVVYVNSTASRELRDGNVLLVDLLDARDLPLRVVDQVGTDVYVAFPPFPARKVVIFDELDLVKEIE